VTKKSVCVELLDREGGATLDEMAKEIADRGLDADLKVNRTTCSLWMTKIGFKVERNKETGKYTRTAVATAAA